MAASTNNLNNVKRLRGRALDVRNTRLLRREPLCRRCRANNRVTAAEELDHIVPLAKGGADDESNLQPLCGPCHKIKTAEDFGFNAWPAVDKDGWPRTDKVRRANAKR